MAQRFWVGGSGTWSAANTANWSATSGGAGGASVPGAGDDVFFDANSGAAVVTLPSPVEILTLTLTGFIGTLSGGVSIGLNQQSGNGGNVTIPAGMTWSGPGLFWHSAVTGTLITNGKTLGSLTVGAGSPGGTITLGDNCTVSGAVNLSSGTLNTNGKTCTWGSFTSSSANVRTITLGASQITVSGTGIPWDCSTATNLTVPANTATLTFTGSGTLTMRGGGGNWNGLSLVFNAPTSTSCSISANGQYNNLTVIGPAIKTYAFSLSGGPTIFTGTVTITANSTTNRIYCNCGSQGTLATIQAAAVALSNVDFQDIAGAGAAAPFTGTSLGDALGNSGITFTPAAAQAWVGTAGGNWSDVSKWTSRVPLPQDDVTIAAAFAASQTVTIDMPRLGRNVSLAGTTGAPTWTQTATATVYGNFDLGGQTLVGAAFALNLDGRGAHTLRSGGGVIQGSGRTVFVRSVTGSYTVQDDFSWTASFTLSSGTFDANNRNIGWFAVALNVVATRTLNMGTGTWTLQASGAATAWNMVATSLTLNASQATILLAGPSGPLTFTGGGFTYGTLRCLTAATVILQGANTFANLDIETGGRSVFFPAGVTTTITGTLTLAGTSLSSLITVLSSTGGSAATIALGTTGVAVVRCASMQDIAATGTNTPIGVRAGTNVSGNSGLSFWTYALAGGGNWSAVGTWSSGVVPTGTTDVALPSGSGNVTADAGATCRNFDATGYTGTLTLAASLTLAPVGGGGITFASTMTLAGGFTVNINPTGAGVATLTTNGKALPLVNIFGSSGATIQLADALTVTNQLTLSQGIFDTNGKTCTWGVFASSLSNSRTLTLGASAITITSGGNGWNMATATGLTITPNTATITFTGAAAGINLGSKLMSGTSLVFSGSGVAWIAGSGTVANVTRLGTATKTDGLAVQSAVVCTGTLTITGNSAVNRLLVQSGFSTGTPSPGVAATLTAAVVALSNADFMDVIAAGAAVPFTGTSLGDCGGNTGITFTAPVTRYAVAPGNWSATATWSASSGGAGGASVPLPQDAALFDANAAAGTYTVDVPRLCKDLDFTGFTRTFTNPFAGGAAIYGNLTLGAAMIYSTSNAMLCSGRGNYTITSNGKATVAGITITAPGGTYTLADDLNIGSQALTFLFGGFVAGSKNVTCGTVNGSNANTRSVSLGSGTWNVFGSGTAWNFNNTIGLTFAPNTATITLTINAAAVTFSGGGLTYGTLRYTPTGAFNIAIVGSNTFAVLDVECTTAKTLTLDAGGTTTVTKALTLLGASGQVLTVVSSTPGTPTTLLVKSPATYTVNAFVTFSADVVVTVDNKGASYPIALAAATVYSVQARVMGPAGRTVRIALWDNVTGKQVGTATTLTGASQRLTMTATTGVGATQFAVYVETDVAQPSFAFNVDAVQVEAKATPNPYVKTDGATATRAAARVRAPISAIDERQAWVAFRVRYGYPSGVTPNSNPGLFLAFDDNTHLLDLFLTPGTGRWSCNSKNGSGGLNDVRADSPPQAWLSGDFATIIGAWDASRIAVAINGAPFTSTPRGSSTPTLAATQFDIGSLVAWFGPSAFDGDILWAACGLGSLADADSAALHAFGNAGPADVATVPGSPQMVWLADTSGALVATYAPQADLPTYKALVAAKPGGLVLNYVVSAGQLWQQVKSTGRTWAQVKAAYATWDDVRNDKPTS